MLSKFFRSIKPTLPKKSTFYFSSYTLDSIEAELERSITNPEALKEVKRVLYGKEETPIEITHQAQKIADANDFEIKSYKIDAAKE